jgi:prepilin-type N-terminal cleavage/methylation domain-containing protein
MVTTKEEIRMKTRPDSGFTLVELLVAIALGLVILAGVYQTFRTQHDSYIVQDQVAAMQQNLRAAMYLITRDLQMAGWYTNFDRENRDIDWYDLDEDRNPFTGQEPFKPLLMSYNSESAGDGIRDGTNMMVIVKAANGSLHKLSGTETASGTSISINLGPSALNATSNKYGLLVKNDLRIGDFFVLTAPGSLAWPLSESYQGDPNPEKADMLFRGDIIIYKIDENPDRPTLLRGNLGNWNGYQPVAENIDNMQVRYQLADGTWHDTVTSANQNQVRAVDVLLVGRTALPQRGYTDTNTITFGDTTIPAPNDHYRRKSLSTIVKTRNVGL